MASGLNPEQQAAVDTLAGPMLVLALAAEQPGDAQVAVARHQHQADRAVEVQCLVQVGAGQDGPRPGHVVFEVGRAALGGGGTAHHPELPGLECHI